MSPLLVMLAGDTPAEPVDWLCLDEAGHVRESGVAWLGDLAELHHGRRVLLLPGHQVTAHETSLSARSERQALAAAPYAIEDDVGLDPDGLHVALGPVRRPEESRRRVAYACDRTLLESWIDALDEAGLNTRIILPDYLALTQPSDGVSLLELETRTLVRDGDWGAGVSSDLGIAVLDAVVEARAAGRAVESLASQGASGRYHLGEAGVGDPRAVLAQGAIRALEYGWTLRQGRLALSGETQGVGLRGWRLPVGLGAAVILGLVGLNLIEGLSFSARADAIERETRQAFRQAFPEMEQGGNPRAQLRTLSLQGETGAPGFLVLSAMVAAGAQARPEIEVTSLRYDGETGELIASLLFSTYDQLAAFREAIEAQGGQVEEGGSRQAGNRRAGEIIVRRK